MRSAIRVRLTYANVVSSLCLFILLGGVGWAATTLPRNSVGSKQIKRSAVRSSDVRNGALAAKDLSAGARKSLRGQQGPAGLAGAPGTPGLKGDTGPRGPSDAWLSYNASTGTDETTTLTLPAGNYVLDGKAIATQTGGDASFLSLCFIYTPAESPDDAGPQHSYSQAVIGPDGGGGSATLAPLRTLALEAETEVTMQCGATKTTFGDGTVSIQGLTLVATQVETLH